MCSAQGQVLHCKLRHQGCNSAQRQVFHCELRNPGCSFSRDEIRGATAPKSQGRLKWLLTDGSTGGLVVSKALIPQP